MFVDLQKELYTEDDMLAAFKTGRMVTLELERYCSEAEAILADIKIYPTPTSVSGKVVQKSNVVWRYTQAARLAGRVDQIGEYCGSELVSPYSSRMDKCLGEIIMCLHSIENMEIKPEQADTSAENPTNEALVTN